MKHEYDLRHIMLRAWKVFRKEEGISFAEALHRAWISEKAAPENERRVADAKAAAEVTEECDTWSGWKERGFEVVHGSKALFGVNLIWGSKGGAEYKARFFGASQVVEMVA